jgi:hypothetical protein
MPELLTGLVSGTRMEAIKAEPVCYPHGCQQPLATHSTILPRRTRTGAQSGFSRPALSHRTVRLNYNRFSAG